MKKFNLTEALTGHRDEIIAKYNKAKDDTYFDGVTMRQWGFEVIAWCQSYGIKGEKMLSCKLEYCLGELIVNHTKRFVTVNDRDAARARKAPNGQWLAIL